MSGKIIEVAAAIIWRDGCYLAADRPAGKPMAGFWEFPGGKFEPGEDAASALIRELEEELGIRALAPRQWRELVHHYPDRTVRLHVFHVTRFSGEPRPREGQRIQWLNPAEAAGSLHFLPADLPLVEELRGLPVPE